MKALVGAFNQEKALVGAFSVITNLRMQFGWNFLKHYPPVPASGSHYVQRGETIALFIAGREPRNGLGFDAH